jgi:hypothetical protein
MRRIRRYAIGKKDECEMRHDFRRIRVDEINKSLQERT